MPESDTRKKRALNRKDNAHVLFVQEKLFNPDRSNKEIVAAIAENLGFSKKTIYEDLQPIEQKINDLIADRYFRDPDYQSIIEKN